MTQRPEHDFSKDREEWQQSVIDNAALFTSVRFLGRARYDRREFSTAAEAIADAETDGRGMVYAVTKSDRSVMIPRRDYDKYKGAKK